MADHTFFVHKERLGRTVDTEVNGGAAVSVHHGHVIGISEVIEPLLCGKALVLRKDDAPETVQNRLRVFHAETEPLKDFYAKLGVLKLVEGNQPIESATKDILAALGV